MSITSTVPLPLIAAQQEADTVLNFLWRKEFFCFRERLKQSRVISLTLHLPQTPAPPAVTVYLDSCVSGRISQQCAFLRLIRNVVRYEGYSAFAVIH